MKNKKGFTLIELLAVILILGIIALIAIPTVTNIIKESKKGAFKSTFQNVMKAIETNCQTDRMEGYDIVRSYDLADENLTKRLNIKGNLPTDGIITVDDNCNVATITSVTNGEFIAILEPSGLTIVEAAVSFEKDSWDTIAKNVKAGNLSKYNVGDTKEISLEGFDGTFTVRIANTSTPSECSTEGFSQTACGFVIEFADVITRRVMNSTATNVGGWNASEMKNYVNDTIYKALPDEISNNIISTFVVSGHGNTEGEKNFTTTDKLYLLSITELYGYQLSDTAVDQTRQLDYYAANDVRYEVNVGFINNSVVSRNGARSWFWLRTPLTIERFEIIDTSGVSVDVEANDSNGVVPAFRIG